MICKALRDLVPFVQFKKLEKHPLRSATFSRIAGSVLESLFNKVPGLKACNFMKKRLQHSLLLKILHGCFFCFLNCTNGTKSRITYQIVPNKRLITVR